jgi:peptide/nickel transport system permease protein
MTGASFTTSIVGDRRRLATLRRENRPPLMVIVALGFMALVIAAAVAGQLIAPHDPELTHLRLGLSAPSREYLFGTDQIGRDIFSRVIVGTWSTVSGPLVMAFGMVVLGGGLGIVAGYVGGWVDVVIGRYVDLMWSLPGLLVTIIIIGIVGGGYWGAVAVLIFLNATNDVRMFRAAALEQRGLPYVEAARMLGLGRRRIMARHIGPNVMPLLVTSFCLDFASSLTAMAGLAFLGFGLAPGQANWGTMVEEYRLFIFDNPWGSLLPTAMVVATAISMDLIGNWLYNRFTEKGASR